MNEHENVLSVKCPHPGCSDYMKISVGYEVDRILLCDTCKEYYYKVGSIISIRCCTPKSIAEADLILAPHGQPLKREIVNKLNLLRERFGLQPFSQSLQELGQDDES